MIYRTREGTLIKITPGETEGEAVFEEYTPYPDEETVHKCTLSGDVAKRVKVRLELDYWARVVREF